MLNSALPTRLRATSRALSVPLLLLGTSCAVSTQQEVEMGASYAAEVERQLPIVRDPEIVRYINVLGDSVARVADGRNLEWHFAVVDSKEVNAFAIPGGYIYVNRGLIERAKTMSEIAGVLGHEIGHVTQRHSIDQMRKQQGANLGVTLACVLTNICNSEASRAAINIGAGALFAKFTRTDEAEADSVGLQYVLAARIDPRGIPSMFRILLTERKDKPDAVESWFITHPLEEDRITTTEALIGRLAPEALARVTKDTPNFHAFQDRLRSLPPPRR